LCFFRKFVGFGEIALKRGLFRHLISFHLGGLETDLRGTGQPPEPLGNLIVYQRGKTCNSTRVLA
jgi:hypothetical protein